jgi:undecaprenyl-diphosphatase
MGNIFLFDRINASASTPHWQIAAALLIAQWVIWAIPIGLVVAWVRGDGAARVGLLEIALAVFIALGFGQVITHLWPEPRPFMLHLGTQFLPHDPDPGMPSDHVTVFWSLACAALATRRFRACAFPLFAMGLLVGWSRVFLGVHFPFDVLGALPVAAAGVLTARALRAPLVPLYVACVRCWGSVAGTLMHWARRVS